VPGYEPGGREFESLRAHHYTETAGHGLLFFYACFSAGLRPAPLVVPAAGRQPQRQKQQLAFRGLAGRHGQAGHAVNPSMGARWRHPCRQRSCLPMPPHL
ncbi:hypothetical protein C9416_19520, partial [Stenotrophomonas sp. Nf4]